MLGMYLLLLCEQNADSFENWTNVVDGGWLWGGGCKTRKKSCLDVENRGENRQLSPSI